MGRKLQAGRSRNDQVAAALRLYVVDACAEAIDGIEALARTLLDRAEEEAETPLPGYTHLQRAQPVTLGHHLLAWVEMLDRDRGRFRFAAEAAPALAARSRRARRLDARPPRAARARRCATRSTPSPTATSRSTTCTRAPSSSATSRGSARRSTLWVSSEFGFARLPESAATGSSLMPQKLNPDVAELVRGKAGTALGRLTGLLAVVKGLPLAYNRDLQEDKTPVFAARRDTRGALARPATPSSPGSTSTASGWPRPAPTRSCARPTRPRRSCETACRSGTPTSRSRARCATERLSRPANETVPPTPGPGGIRRGARLGASALLARAAQAILLPTSGPRPTRTVTSTSSHPT